MRSVLIIGGGLAGTRCAEALRAGGFDGSLVVAGAEPRAPYERPALSKQLLDGSRDAASLALRDDGAWRAAGIDLRLDTPIVQLDVDRRRASARSGEALSYDVLVLATGARPRSHPALSNVPGVHHLRTVDDAARLREQVRAGDRLAIVGAGLIGAEVASTMQSRGVIPILIEAAPTPLTRAFGAEVGALLSDRWRAAGVAVRTGAHVRGPRLGRHGRIESLALGDGSTVACDHVLVSIGAVPETGLAADLLELAVDGGVTTDSCGRTSASDVFACGDVASWHRPAIDAGFRAESWTSAAQQAAAVARAILDDAAPAHDEPLYAWSDQFGLRLQHISTGAAWRHVEIDDEGTDFEARYLDGGGRLVGALVANRPRAVPGLRRRLSAEYATA